MTREETPKFGMSKAIDEFEKGLTSEDIKNAPFAMVEQAIRFGGEWKKKELIKKIVYNWIPNHIKTRCEKGLIVEFDNYSDMIEDLLNTIEE